MTYIETTPGMVWSSTGFTTPDATVRTRWQDFDTLLQSLGLVEVATETGRISSFAAIPLNVTAETFYGFKLYAWTDARQVSRPIFMKVEFGSSRSGTGADANSGAIFRITLFSGTDGAGNLGAGQSSSGQYFFGLGQTTAYASAQIRAVYSSVFGCLYIGLIGLSVEFISLERTRDPSGVPTNEGLDVRVGTARSGLFQFNRFVKTNSASSWTLARNGNSTSTQMNYGVGIVPTYLASNENLSYDGGTGVMLHHPFTFKPYPPNMAILGVNSNDFGSDTMLAISRYGTPQTYKTILPQSSGGQGAMGSSQARVAICTSI